MQLTKKNITDLVLITILFVISSFLLFFKIDTKQIQNWDEGLYANIVGEITTNGDWLHFTLQGQPWLEKEPLPFWLEALSLKIFGTNSFGLRFPAVFFSLFLAPLIYLIARKKLQKTWSFFASLLFLLSPLIWYPHMIRTADFDMLSLSLFLTALTLYIYTRGKKWWWTGAIFISLGLLSRGVMGILYLGIILVAEYSRPLFGLARFKIKQFISFVSISLIPWILWHIFLYITYGNEYIRIYWTEQFFTRITNSLQGHTGSNFFYIDFIQKQAGIFLLVCFVLGIISTTYLLKKYKQWYFLFLILWILATVIPPHILHTKLEWYILPTLPPLYIALFSIPDALLKKIKRPYVSNILCVIIVLPLIIYSSILFTQQTKYIQTIKKTPMQNFIEEISIIIPTNEQIILYNVENWNMGRTLPAFYWYLHYEQQHIIVSIDNNNLEYYAMHTNTYPWWIVDTNSMDDITSVEDIFSYTRVVENPSYTLLHVTPKTLLDR